MSTIQAGEGKHSIVGHYFRRYIGGIYFCDSYDPTCGYWLTNVDDEKDKVNVSERAINRTVHEISYTPPKHKL